MLSSTQHVFAKPLTAVNRDNVRDRYNAPTVAATTRRVNGVAGEKDCWRFPPVGSRRAEIQPIRTHATITNKVCFLARLGVPAISGGGSFSSTVIASADCGHQK